MLELGAQQVGDGDQVVVGGITFRPCLGGLDLCVHRLDEAVAQAAAEVLDDASPVLVQGGTQTLERRQPAAARPADPPVQLVPGPLMRTRCRVEAAQRLLQAPRTGRLQAAALQPVHGADLRVAPAPGILEQRPAAALQVRLELHFGPSHFVQRPAGQRHHMERVEGRARVRAVFGRTGLERLGHVHAHVGDRFGIAAMRLQVGRKGLEGRCVAARSREQQPPLIRIMEQRDIALAAPAAGLVHTDALDRAVVLLCSRLANMVAQHSPDAVVRHAHQPRHVRYRHRLAQRDHERLHHQREARPRTRPRRLDLTGLAACRAGHPRQPGVDEGLELEEVEVLPAALDPVMDRLLRGPAGRTRQPLGLTLDGKVDGALRLPEVDRGDRPRRAQTQCLCEKLFHPPRLPGTLPSGKSVPQESRLIPHPIRCNATD